MTLNVFSVFTEPRFTLSGIKNLTGREGAGLMFTLKLDDKKFVTYADYGDGAEADIDFTDKDGRARLLAMLKPFARQLLEKEAAMHPFVRAQLDALTQNKNVSSRIEGRDEDRVTTLKHAELRLVDNWLGEQVEIMDKVKSCRKGIAFVDKKQPWVTSTYNMPFTPANRQFILDKHFNGDASLVEFCNETYDIMPSPLEAFDIEYGKRLKELQSGKKVVFRELTGDDGQLSSKGWREYDAVKINKTTAEIRHLIGNRVEFMLDILLAMREELKSEPAAAPAP